MTRPHSIIRQFIVTACAVVLLTAPAVAGDAILKVVPKNSTAFAVVNGLEKADQVCKELGQATMLPLPSPAMVLKQATGLGDSLDMKGDMAVVLYVGDADLQGPPPMIAVLPISDYKKMLSQFDGEEVTDTIQKVTINGTEVLVAEKGDYTIIAQTPDQKVLEAFLAEKENVAEAMKPWKAWADQNVIYGVVTNYGLTETMKTGIESLEGTLESFKQFGESSPQLDQIKKTFEVYLSIMKGIRDNANQIGAGLSTTSSGAIKISGRCDAAPGSDLIGMLDQVKALPSDPMEVLPSGSFVFAGGGPIPQKLVASFIELGQTMSAGQLGLDAEQNAKMTQLSIDAMKAMVGESLVFGAPTEEKKALIDGAYAAMWVDDADAYLTSYVKQVKGMEALFAKAEKPMMRMEAKETTIDGTKVVVATTDMSGMVDSPEAAPAANFIKSLYGENLKIKAYIAKVSDTLLVSAVGSEAHLKKAIKVAKSKSDSLAGDSGIKEVTAMLPKDAQWVGYWSPSGTVEFVNWILGKLPEQLADTIPVDKLPPFPPSTPVGIAVKAGDGVIEKTVVLPPSTLRGAMMYFMQIQMMGAH